MEEIKTNKMETRFYIGNYSSGLGQPYVIISATEDNSHFRAETIIFFDAFDGSLKTLASRIKYPKVDNRTLNDFIEAERQVCKDDIFYKILFTHYKEAMGHRNYNINIELGLTNSNILSLIKDKFPSFLNKIEANTINEKLKVLIGLYKSIIIERTDFNIHE